MTGAVRTSSPAEARVIRGAPIAAALRDKVATDVARFRQQYGFSPGLAVVRVGQEEASSVYLRRILRTCEMVGVPGRAIELPASATAGELRTLIEQLNAEQQTAGIIVQMPLPAHIPVSTVTDTILPAKDIDGIHPLNAGLMTLGYEGFLPACAEATVGMLKHSGYQLAGKRAVVIGRSNVIGKPVQLLLMRENCTVIACHRQTRDLVAEVRRAEVLVAAAGSPRLVTGDMLSPGVLIVDAGINVVGGDIVGDVDFDSAVEVAAAITPVPGGVGPLTNAVLLEHLVRAARWQQTGHPITAGHGRRRDDA